jgi:hypothetical protein
MKVIRPATKYLLKCKYMTNIDIKMRRNCKHMELLPWLWTLKNISGICGVVNFIERLGQLAQQSHAMALYHGITTVLLLINLIVADPKPGSEAFLPPRSGINFFPDPESASGMSYLFY